MAMIECPQCACPTSDEAIVCPQCGAELATAEESFKTETITCEECGEEFEKGTLACPQCGYPTTAPAKETTQGLKVSRAPIKASRKNSKKKKIIAAVAVTTIVAGAGIAIGMHLSAKKKAEQADQEDKDILGPAVMTVLKGAIAVSRARYMVQDAVLNAVFENAPKLIAHLKNRKKREAQ